ARDASTEPEDLADPEVHGEQALELRARHAGVPCLRAREQALLGGEEGAAAVGVDGAALEDDVARVAAERGLPPAAAEGAGERVAGGRVPPVIAVLRPAVEAPVDEGDVAVVASHEERAGIAHPGAVGRDAKEVHPPEIHAGVAEDALSASLQACVVDQDTDALAR